MPSTAQWNAPLLQPRTNNLRQSTHSERYCTRTTNPRAPQQTGITHLQGCLRAATVATSPGVQPDNTWTVIPTKPNVARQPRHTGTVQPPLQPIAVRTRSRTHNAFAILHDDDDDDDDTTPLALAACVEPPPLPLAMTNRGKHSSIGNFDVTQSTKMCGTLPMPMN